MNQMRSMKSDLLVISLWLLPFIILGIIAARKMELIRPLWFEKVESPCATEYVLINPQSIGYDFIIYLAENNKVKVTSESQIQGMDWVVLDDDLRFVLTLDGTIYTTHPCYTDHGVEYRDITRTEPQMNNAAVPPVPK